MQRSEDVKGSPEIITFLDQLEDLGDEEAEELLAKETPIYERCIEMLLVDQEQARLHSKAIITIENHIISQENPELQELKVLKICQDSGIGHSHFLPWAIKEGYLELAAKLIEAGFDINTPDADGYPPFFYLLNYSYQLEIVQQLTQQFLNHPDFDLYTRFQHEHSNPTLFQHAIGIRNFDFICRLIEVGAFDHVDSNNRFDIDLFRYFAKEEEKLLKDRFAQLPGINGISEEAQEALASIWLHPQDNASADQCEIIAKWMTEHPQQAQAFFQTFPNLTTKILKNIFDKAISLEQLRGCLDALPGLLKEQYGRQLLFHVIEKNQYLALQELINRGIDPNLPYGTPIDVVDYRTPLSSLKREELIPWQHALKCNQDEMAALLLANSPEAASEAFKLLLEQPNAWKEHSTLLSSLITNGVNCNITNSNGDSLLEQIASLTNKDKIPWPLVQQMVTLRSPLSTDGCYNLLQRAISEYQFTTANLLIDNIPVKELLPKIDHALLVTLCRQPNQTWVQAQLEKWVAQGLQIDKCLGIEGEDLLAQIIQENNYPLAAFLMSQGLDSTPIEHLISPKKLDLLKKYAKQLKRGSPSETALREELNLRNLGHLLGDAFLEEMVNIQNIKLEGNQPSYSLSFMQKIISHLMEKHANKFSSEVLDKLDALKQQLKTTYHLALEIEGLNCISAKDPKSPFLPQGLKQFSLEVQRQLRELPPDQTLWLPYGWSGVQGHAMMIGCQRTAKRVLLHVINTGSGIGFHELQHDYLKTYANTVRTFAVPSEVAEDPIFLQQLFEPAVLGEAVDKMPEQRYSYNDVYALLQPYACDLQDSESLTQWKHEQHSGTCTFRCLQAMVALAIGPEYKIFNPLAKKEVATLALQQNQELIQDDPAMTKIVSEALPRLFGHIAKALERNPSPENEVELLEIEMQLKELKSWHQKLKEVLPEERTSQPLLQYAADLPTSTTEVQSSFKPLVEVEGKEKDKDSSESISKPPLLPSLNTNHLKSAEGILQTLGSFHAYLSDAPSSSNEAIADSLLIELSRALIDKKGRVRDKIYQELKANPRTCLIALHQLCSNLIHAGKS